MAPAVALQVKLIHPSASGGPAALDGEPVERSRYSAAAPSNALPLSLAVAATLAQALFKYKINFLLPLVPDLTNLYLANERI